MEIRYVQVIHKNKNTISEFEFTVAANGTVSEYSDERRSEIISWILDKNYQVNLSKNKRFLTITLI